MLTIDDINSINQKYGNIGFWQEIDLTKIDTDNVYFFNGIRVKISDMSSNTVLFNITWNSIVTPVMYVSYQDGTISSEELALIVWEYGKIGVTKQNLSENHPILHIYCTFARVNYWMQPEIKYLVFKALQPPLVTMVDGKYDEKFYILPIGTEIKSYQIDGKMVEHYTDEKGTYILIPPHDCVIGSYFSESDDNTYPFYKVNFKEFKTLPILSISPIYKCNTQTIQLLDDTEEITEFQAYYKGELLTDNKITLPYDADDYIDITVDLLDNRYPNSTLKLKAPTMMYIANSQSDVETAISQGITTLQVGDTETEVLLNNIELSNITLVDSNIQLTNSTLNNCTILNSQYTDNGANTITNTIIRNTDYTNTNKSVYENTSFYNSRIQDSELQITGTIYECELTNSLIISDGTININNNTFTGIGSKTYFPSHLYLTGDYIVSGNTFNLTGTFTELQFNMCLIKATNDFNVGEFINKNTFQLNIEYETEPTSTLYYNIVDDDKIRARRI